MKLHEIDSTKRYVLAIECADIATEDLSRMQERLQERGLYNITIVAGPVSMSEPLRYWGIWVSPPNQQPGWARNGSGDFLYYPSPVLAEARRTDLGWEHCEVKEFTLGDTLRDVEDCLRKG
ncbi:MAG TPA: hypothetical protein VL866_24295 [Pyrinomonadaceae bacterium]|nr:hypothetical protein [Pyrinomonadaceae bacterium]